MQRPIYIFDIRNSIKKYFAEFVGTFALVFAGTGSIIIDNLTGQLSHIGVSFVFGLKIGRASCRERV